MGTIVNKAYVDRSFHAIVVIGLFTIVIFCARGAATYFQAVILSRSAMPSSPRTSGNCSTA